MPDGKQPYTIARRDRSPVTFAGVWEWWKVPDGAGPGALRAPAGEAIAAVAIRVAAAAAVRREHGPLASSGVPRKGAGDVTGLAHLGEKVARAPRPGLTKPTSPLKRGLACLRHRYEPAGGPVPGGRCRWSG